MESNQQTVVISTTHSNLLRRGAQLPGPGAQLPTLSPGGGHQSDARATYVAQSRCTINQPKLLLFAPPPEPSRTKMKADPQAVLLAATLIFQGRCGSISRHTSTPPHLSSLRTRPSNVPSRSSAASACATSSLSVRLSRCSDIAICAVSSYSCSVSALFPISPRSLAYCLRLSRPVE